MLIGIMRRSRSAGKRNIVRRGQKKIKEYDKLLNRSSVFEKRLKTLKFLFFISALSLVVIAVFLHIPRYAKAVEPFAYLLLGLTGFSFVLTIHYHRALTRTLRDYEDKVINVLKKTKQ